MGKRKALEESIASEPEIGGLKATKQFFEDRERAG